MQHFDHKNAKDLIYPCSLWLSALYGLFSPYSLSALSVLISLNPFVSPLSYPFFSPVHMQPPEMGRNKNNKASSSKSLCLKPQNDSPSSQHTHSLSHSPSLLTPAFTQLCSGLMVLHSDSCFRSFALGERCNVSFKSMPISALFLHNLDQGAHSEGVGGGGRAWEKTQAAEVKGLWVPAAGEIIQTGIIYTDAHSFLWVRFWTTKAALVWGKMLKFI